MTQRTEQEEDRAEPPAPPPVGRSLQLNWPQLIGFPALALIPLLAILGVFGEHWATAVAEGGPVRMHVEFPARLRAKLTKPMTVSIENRSAETLAKVEVEFDSAYVERFAAIDFTPPPHDAYVVFLTDVKPGEHRRVHVEFEGDQVGKHAGRVVARAGGDSAVAVVHTIVFP